MPDPFPDPIDSGTPRLVAEEVPGDNALTVVGRRARRPSSSAMVEGEFGHVRLRGEISGYKRVASGHAYLCAQGRRRR